MHTAHMCGHVQVVVRRCEKKALDVWAKRPSVSESNMSVSAEKDLQVGEDERRQEVSRRPLC